MARSCHDRINARRARHLADSAASLTVAGYTREERQGSPAPDALSDTAMMLRDAGREVPHVMVEAIRVANYFAAAGYGPE